MVPPNQAETMAAAARAKGLPVALIMFAGEGHGFRRAETIKAATEAQLYFLGRIFGFTPADDLPPITIDNLRLTPAQRSRSPAASSRSVAAARRRCAWPDPDGRRAVLDGQLEVAGHAHRQLVVAARQTRRSRSCACSSRIRSKQARTASWSSEKTARVIRPRTRRVSNCRSSAANGSPRPAAARTSAAHRRS